MSEEKVPADLDVELRWPKQKDRDELASLPAGKAKAGALVPAGGRARRPVPDFDGLLRQLIVRLDAVGKRVDGLGRSVERMKAGPQLRGISKRLDVLSKSVESIKAGAPVAEVMGRVDALADTVDKLCGLVETREERAEHILAMLQERLEPLDKATAEVRRLSEVVATSLTARIERQGELQSQIEGLTRVIQDIGTVDPAQEAESGDLAGVIAAAVRDAVATGTPKPSAPKKRTATKAKSPAKAARTKSTRKARPARARTAKA